MIGTINWLCLDCQEAATRTTRANGSKWEIAFAGHQTSTSTLTDGGHRKDLGDARFSSLKKPIWCPVHSTHRNGGETDGTTRSTVGVFNYGADQDGNLRGARQSVYRLRRGRDVVGPLRRNVGTPLPYPSDMIFQEETS